MTIETASILVVDDDPVTLTAVGHTLTRLGIHDVHFAANGAEALKLLTSFTPTVILTDIHMKHLGGFEFVKILRSIPKATVQDLPVIFMSADTTRSTFEKAKELGSDGYIIKPPRMEVLKAKIEHAMAHGETKA